MISPIQRALNRVGVACIFALGLLLGACGSDDSDGDGLPASDTLPTLVSVSTTPDANDGTPVTIEIVYIMKSSLARKLADISAKEWFEQREKLQKNHGDSLRVSSWQVPPGMRDAQIPAAEGTEDAVVVLAFAMIDAPGSHRINLMGRERAQVVVEKTSFHLQD